MMGGEMTDSIPQNSAMAELDRQIRIALAAPDVVYGRPPGDPPDCTCFHCLVWLGNDPTTIRLVETGHLPPSTLRLPAGT